MNGSRSPAPEVARARAGPTTAARPARAARRRRAAGATSSTVAVRPRGARATVTAQRQPRYAGERQSKEWVPTRSPSGYEAQVLADRAGLGDLLGGGAREVDGGGADGVELRTLRGGRDRLPAGTSREVRASSSCRLVGGTRRLSRIRAAAPTTPGASRERSGSGPVREHGAGWVT